MKLKSINCPPLLGSISVPGDKSISHRALMLASLAEGQTLIDGLLMGQDCIATLEAMRRMGVKIETQGTGSYLVEGRGLYGLSKPLSEINCGNAGTGMRLLAGLLAGQKFNTTLIGDGSLSKRPMQRIIEPLRRMGAKIETSKNGTAPLMISGVDQLQGIHYQLPMASAQVKSCLLLAGLYAKGRTTIIEPAVTRNHTELMLQTFGYPIVCEGNTITIEGGHRLIASSITVPGDISSAAFFIVAASIIPGSDIIIKNVGVNPSRIGILDVLKLMGANISLQNQRQEGFELVADIQVRSSQLHGIEIPEALIPLAIDEFPVIFIAAACAEGKTVLRNAEELRVKESDRLAVMAEGLRNIGVTCTLFEDGIEIHHSKVKGGQVYSHDDHRISMAFCVAGCVSAEPITVMGCENVATSFPGFVTIANTLGFRIC